MSETSLPNHIACPRSQQLYRRAKQLIPGGTQLLSKRPEMFAPDQWPAYYASARGCKSGFLHCYLERTLRSPCGNLSPQPEANCV